MELKTNFMKKNKLFQPTKMCIMWELPGGPVVRTLGAFTAVGSGSIPGRGNKIPQAARPKKVK